MARSDTDSKDYYNAPGPSTKKTKLSSDITYVESCSKEHFHINATESADNESQRSSQSQIIGDLVIENQNNLMQVDNESRTLENIQKTTQTAGVRLNKAPKTSAERGREYRARKRLKKQQSEQQQKPDSMDEAATEDNQNTVSSEIKMNNKKTSAERTRRWREKKRNVSGLPKKQPKTDAERMREYRQRKKRNINIARWKWEKQQELQQGGTLRTEIDLSIVKEEMIEVEEAILKIKEAENILSDNPLDVQIKDEDKRLSCVSLAGPSINSDSFDSETRSVSMQEKVKIVRDMDLMFVGFATRFKSLSSKRQQSVEEKIGQIISEAEEDDRDETLGRQQE